MNVDYSPLWRLLVDKQISTSKLSSDTGISKATFSRMKQGQDITVSKLLTISDALKCSMDQVVNYELQEDKKMKTIMNIENDNSLGDFTQWVQNVAVENPDKAGVLSKLIGDDKIFATSIKLKTGSSDINSLDVEYMDSEGFKAHESFVITPEDSECCEGSYDDFCKAVYVGMCTTCLSSEQLAKVF